MSEKKFYYGGQAVIECVMICGKNSLAVATGHTNGQISIANPHPASKNIKASGERLRWCEV
jgi:uncharacterized protein YqhQ